MSTPRSIRNVAIIAHVDHGKTTLVDQMLRASGQFRPSQLEGDQILDSNPLERERGITILAKNVSIQFQDVKINLIDTPGHADFGGEVERVLKMADGALLLVDSFEGPMPQTRYVLIKAFEVGLKPLVVINKIDRTDGRPNEVLNEVFDLFVELGANDETLDFPTIYASAKEGWASWDVGQRTDSVQPLLEAIIEHVPPPEGDAKQPLQMLTTTLAYSDYVGRIAIGRVFAGSIHDGQNVMLLKRDDQQLPRKVTGLLTFTGLGRQPIDHVDCGDICAVVGLEDVDIGDTIADTENPRPLPLIAVDEPMLHMTFRVNDSPLAGREGQFLTSRQIRERLHKEVQSNVALRIEQGHRTEEFFVSGRGLLHLSILIENMRREGFELAVGKPKVIYKELNNRKTEPIENLVIEVPPPQVGAVMELLGGRKAECRTMDTRGAATHMEFTIPARGLIGLRQRLLTATSGQMIMHHNFYQYEYFRGSIPGRGSGVMVATEKGTTTAYALDSAQQRGTLFVGPAVTVYEGQVVGEHCRNKDLKVNVCRAKKMTNMRASGSDENVLLKPPRVLSLEQALEYIEDDELVEVTPSALRLRKRMLTENQRRQAERGRLAGTA